MARSNRLKSPDSTPRPVLGNYFWVFLLNLGELMTGYTVHTGASKKFVSGWDRVFGKGKSGEKGQSKSAGGRSGKTSAGKAAKTGNGN